MPTWDANLYLQFASERTQPALDLIARVGLAHPARIIDLGADAGARRLSIAPLDLPGRPD